MTDKLDIGLGGLSFDIEQLHITSCHSAPNRINTRNKHVRKVYHIFTDLSHLGWQQKLTAFYNSVRHNVDKNVETLNLKKGK
jgi:hypothetical protein